MDENPQGPPPLRIVIRENRIPPSLDERLDGVEKSLLQLSKNCTRLEWIVALLSIAFILTYTFP